MFLLRHIQQIELTSRCNLRCRYCPSPHLKRAKQDMSVETFERALHWVRFFVSQRTQGELDLGGIGEPTLHPEFVRFLYLAREAIGFNGVLVFPTNGLLMTDELAREIAGARPRAYVSLHRPERAGLAVEALRKVGLLAGVSADPSIAATNWAGQVKWHVSAQPGRQCGWVRNGRAFVMSTGHVSRCGFDASGIGVFGHVDDDLSLLATSPYELCRTCDQDVGVPIPDAVQAAVA